MRLGTPAVSDLQELVAELNSMRLTNMTSLNTIMTGHGATQLQHFITPLGQRFMRYVISA